VCVCVWLLLSFIHMLISAASTNDFILLVLDEIEDSIQHDDGFDSEATTLTPVSCSNDYYNSLDHVWLRQKLSPENLAKPKPTRGNSESMGSLDTNASDHDYYNEFHPPVTSDRPFLEGNGTATSVV